MSAAENLKELESLVLALSRGYNHILESAQVCCACPVGCMNAVAVDGERAVEGTCPVPWHVAVAFTRLQTVVALLPAAVKQ